MEQYWECKISSSDFEKYREFFPDLIRDGHFFRPWMDKDHVKDEYRSETLRSVANERSSGIQRSIKSHATKSKTVDTVQEAFCTKREPSPLAGGNRRKSSHPHRSADANDPTFRGVTFSVQPQLSPTDRSKCWQTQLCIKSYFTVRGLKLTRALRNRHCGSYEDSSSDADDIRDNYKDHGVTEIEVPSTLREAPSRSYLSTQRPSRQARLVGTNGKQCASCSAKRTPLWRDAEDGTPLCNACGIRYKKYRIRCTGCWLIPRKDGKSFTTCIRCGQEFRVSVFRRSNKQ